MNQKKRKLPMPPKKRRGRKPKKRRKLSSKSSSESGKPIECHSSVIGEEINLPKNVIEVEGFCDTIEISNYTLNSKKTPKDNVETSKTNVTEGVVDFQVSNTKATDPLCAIYRGVVDGNIGVEPQNFSKEFGKILRPKFPRLANSITNEQPEKSKLTTKRKCLTESGSSVVTLNQITESQIKRPRNVETSSPTLLSELEKDLESEKDKRISDWIDNQAKSALSGVEKTSSYCPTVSSDDLSYRSTTNFNTTKETSPSTNLTSECKNVNYNKKPEKNQVVRRLFTSPLQYHHSQGTSMDADTFLENIEIPEDKLLLISENCQNNIIGNYSAAKIASILEKDIAKRSLNDGNLNIGHPTIDGKPSSGNCGLIRKNPNRRKQIYFVLNLIVFFLLITFYTLWIVELNRNSFF
ncbi:hypothetical protein SNEBB_004300 [Seison nebaliae]|nr:hypothetical protein SNEBB_004300 [Seison nebaliae]